MGPCHPHETFFEITTVSPCAANVFYVSLPLITQNTTKTCIQLKETDLIKFMYFTISLSSIFLGVTDTFFLQIHRGEQHNDAL